MSRPLDLGRLLRARHEDLLARHEWVQGHHLTPEHFTPDGDTAIRGMTSKDWVLSLYWHAIRREMRIALLSATTGDGLHLHPLDKMWADLVKPKFDIKIRLPVLCSSLGSARFLTSTPPEGWFSPPFVPVIAHDMLSFALKAWFEDDHGREKYYTPQRGPVQHYTVIAGTNGGNLWRTPVFDRRDQEAAHGAQSWPP